MVIFVLFFFALVIERVVQLFKPLWNAAMIGKLPVSSLVGMVIGIAVCVLARLSIMDAVPALAAMDFPVSVKYVMYVLTGAATGAGSSVIHDLWARINTYEKT